MSLLDSSIKVGRLEPRNRLVMSPMAKEKWQADRDHQKKGEYSGFIDRRRWQYFKHRHFI
ncbi:MAG: hypothetical protein ACTJHK_06515 [Enterococcus viikkiensis]|uniref:NADH:flavin oxidoreductase/NADH oxidase N-terminal domain-containing protein n=1 Tax=Enterococcus viikkiensis TaxID=930854 RepID=A0ABU3FM05_9ENTE|nr:hypothetical protein [Enterococcus viikkiensis]MDT2827001.1 hypothetical protein [Enterococcus viikkiensis]